MNTQLSRRRALQAAGITAGAFLLGRVNNPLENKNMLSDGRWNYTWDAENRLTSMTVNTTVGPQQRIVFEYDYQGRRIAKKVWNNTAGTGNPATYLKYLYDGWNLIAELNGNSGNALVRSYTWGLDASGSMQGAGGVGGLLMVNAGSGGVHFPAYDLNGNVMGLVNAANGIISAKYEYAPFGEVFCSVGDMAKVNPFQFSTKYTDNETDLLYYGYRYYSPALGRWLSRDPIEEQGGLNLYAFVNNDPVNKVDVIGRQTWIPYPPPGRNISDTPIYREPSGPGAWDQWNPGGLRGRTGEKDYREWFEFRFPKTVEGAKKEILASIIEKGCSTTPRPSILSGIKPVVIEPDMKKFGDKPQTFWEKRFRIGYFSFKADAASLNWNNPCLFYYQTDIYIYEHTGADPLWHSGSNFFPDILWFSGMFVSRDVKMGHWHMEGYACCKK